MLRDAEATALEAMPRPFEDRSSAFWKNGCCRASEADGLLVDRNGGGNFIAVVSAVVHKQTSRLG